MLFVGSRDWFIIKKNNLIDDLIKTKQKTNMYLILNCHRLSHHLGRKNIRVMSFLFLKNIIDNHQNLWSIFDTGS
jgi:hypothetical protein